MSRGTRCVAICYRHRVAELRREIQERAAETRRPFDVVAEALVSKIQRVAEGVIVVDEKLERFRAEVKDESRQVDRRLLLRLGARLLAPIGNSSAGE